MTEEGIFTAKPKRRNTNFVVVRHNTIYLGIIINAGTLQMWMGS